MSTYKITNVGAAKCLNINGSNVTALTNHQNVTIYSDSGSNEQRWEISTIGTGQFVKSVIDTTFGLNVYRSGSPYNCDVFPISGNETDAKVNFVSTTGGYLIKLTNYDLYLTVGSSSNGANVYWAAKNNSNYQLWTVVQASPIPTDTSLGAPVNSTSEYANLSETDLIARCIYSEAGNQGDIGRRGVACVLRNRKNHSRFPNTYRNVILQANQFSGMSTSNAMKPPTTTTNWLGSVDVAKQIETVANPIGNCVFFWTNTLYNNKIVTSASNGVNDIIYFAGANQTVTEKVVIGNHTFFRVSGY